MKVLNILKATLLSSIVATSLMAGDVIATVNGQAVTKEQVKGLLKADFEKLTPEQQKQAINVLTEREMLYQEAKTKGYEKTEDYKKAVEELTKEIYINLWRADIVKAINVSADDSKKYYNQNIDKFKVKDRVLARHILVKTEKEATDVIAELDASQSKLETFKNLAKTKSLGNEAKLEGNLGWFEKDKMVKEFADAAFALKKDTYTKTPVKTQFGYHVIYQEDKKDARTLEFNEVEKLIVQQIKLEKFNDTMVSEIDKIKAKAKIEIK